MNPVSFNFNVDPNLDDLSAGLDSDPRSALNISSTVGKGNKNKKRVIEQFSVDKLFDKVGDEFNVDFGRYTPARTVFEESYEIFADDALANVVNIDEDLLNVDVEPAFELLSNFTNVLDDFDGSIGDHFQALEVFGSGDNQATLSNTFEFSENAPVKNQSYDQSRCKPVIKKPERRFSTVIDNEKCFTPNLFPLASGICSAVEVISATLDPKIIKTPTLSQPAYPSVKPPSKPLHFNPLNKSSYDHKYSTKSTKSDDPCLFTIDQQQESYQSGHASFPKPNIGTDFLCNPVDSIYQNPRNIQGNPISGSPNAPSSRGYPKAQPSSLRIKTNEETKNTQEPQLFSINCPERGVSYPEREINQHRRSYSISQPTRVIHEALDKQNSDQISRLSHESNQDQPIQRPITQSCLKVDPTSSPGNTKIFKSYSTRETKSARLRREDEQRHLYKSSSTKEGSPRLLPPVVIKTRTSSVKARSKSAYVSSHRDSPTRSLLERDYVSSSSPNFQRRNSGAVLQAPLTPIELSSPSRHRRNSTNRSIKSNRSTRSYSVVSRAPSANRSPSRSASVRFFRQSFNKIINPFSPKDQFNQSNNLPLIDSTTIEVTDHDLSTADNNKTTKRRGSIAPKKQSQERDTISERSSASDLQKSRKLRTFQSEDSRDSDHQSEKSSTG